MRKRAALALFIAAIALPLLPSVAPASPVYPERPIKLVVPAAPGGQNDVIGRLLAHELSLVLAQPVVVDNRGGAGGTIGADHVAKSRADGYTLLLGGSNNLAIAPVVRSDLTYDPLRDFSPIGRVASVPYAIAVGAHVPATSVQELVALARMHPGRLSYGSSGVGSTSGMAVQLLSRLAGVDMLHVPYKGSAPAIADLLRGGIDLLITDHALLAPHARSGALRLIGAAGAKRPAGAPELKTMAEQGLGEYDVEPWYGLLAPAGTPAAAIARLIAASKAALRSPELLARFHHLGYEPLPGSPEDLAAAIRADLARYASVVGRIPTAGRGM